MATRELPDVLTPITTQQVYAALQSAWVDRFGSAPKRESLLVLLAQWALETGWGHACHCYNLGNDKGTANDPERCWTYFACDEEEGNPPEIVWHYPKDPACCFRAFETLAEAAADYLELLWDRYRSAWGAVLAGDPANFSHLIKLDHYYTAPEATYTRSLVSIFQHLLATVGVPFDLGTASGLQRALNALGANPQLQVDGRIGGATYAAVKAFQRAHGLAVDGVAGPDTKRELAAELSAP